MDIKLRDYQISSAEFLLRHANVPGRGIVGHPPGAGKTAIGLQAARMIVDAADQAEQFSMRILVVCPGSATFVWEDEVSKWEFPAKPVIITGTPQAREELWRQASFGIINFEALKVDFKRLPFLRRKGFLDILIVDEAHRCRNRKTSNYATVKALGRESKNMFLLTGTPASRGPQDLWGLLNIVDPKTFGSYWSFVNKFCFTEHSDFGHSAFGVRNVAELREILKGYMIRYPKSVILPEMPPKIRQKIPFELESRQRALYAAVAKDMLAEMDDGRVIITPGTLSQLTLLRQITVCPKLVHPSASWGAAFPLLVDLLRDNGEHAAIFTQFAKLIPLLQEYFAANHLPNLLALHGGMKPHEVREVVDTFKRTKGQLICTIDFAEAFSLETCDSAYLLGASYQPDKNEQAEDRCHRMTSKNPVFARYLIARNTAEEHVVSINNDKHKATSAVLSDPISLRAILKRTLGDTL